MPPTTERSRNRRAALFGPLSAAIFQTACGRNDLTPEQRQLDNDLSFFLSTAVPMDRLINPEELNFREYLLQKNFIFDIQINPKKGIVKERQISATKRFPIATDDGLAPLTTKTNPGGTQFDFLGLVTIRKREHPSNNSLRSVAKFIEISPPRSQEELWGVWQEKVIDQTGKVTQEWRFNRIRQWKGSLETYIDLK